jgi:cephalosporin-C deacetylase-like acetyl esterase
MNEFWDSLNADLSRVPGAPELREVPLHSSPTFTTYALRLTSIGPYRLFGYYSVPKNRHTAPGLLLTPRYGSVNHVPDYHDRERYSVLQIMHRGQRLADKPFAAAYPGLLTLGIESAESYIYRAIVADCVRGAEFLLARPEVDSSRVGIMGDDLALITAALRPSFSHLVLEETLLYRLLERADTTSEYPFEEINDHLRRTPGGRDDVERTLSAFDATPLAQGINASVLLVEGNAAGWLDPLRAALPNSETYRLTHLGAVDHDWIDGWLASGLGSEPRARFLERA